VERHLLPEFTLRRGHRRLRLAECVGGALHRSHVRDAGTLSPPDAGFQSTCTASGPAQCVDVPFDYPGPTPVGGNLP
jgi:hypothetical protein